MALSLSSIFTFMSSRSRMILLKASMWSKIEDPSSICRVYNFFLVANLLAIDFLVYKSSSIFHSPEVVFSPPTSLSTPSPRLKIMALWALSNTSGRSSSETFLGFFEDDSSLRASSRP
ncbi:hypothetical protein WN943_019070 [Citrus x changshan-huyou]